MRHQQADSGQADRQTDRQTADRQTHTDCESPALLIAPSQRETVCPSTLGVCVCVCVRVLTLDMAKDAHTHAGYGFESGHA